jgi:hypothetical protein
MRSNVNDHNKNTEHENRAVPTAPPLPYFHHYGSYIFSVNHVAAIPRAVESEGILGGVGVSKNVLTLTPTSI